MLDRQKQIHDVWIPTPSENQLKFFDELKAN